MTRRLRNIAIAAVLSLLCFSLESAATADSPTSVVTNFQHALLEVMKEAEKSTVRERFDQLAPQVDRTFHVPLMTQIATGRFWQDATMEEKAAVVKAFRRMSVATLATLFDGYTGETFATIGERPGPSKTTVVSTKLTKSDKSSVSIAYISRKFGEQWRLIDVIVDGGISELKVRQSEYRLVLKKSGLPGLIDLLNGKADELMSQ